MKKFLVIFMGLMMIAPAMADDPAPSITQYETLTTSAGGTVATNGPKYGLKEITSGDQQHIASTAYVKGAHNTTLTAINYLSDNKQAVLNSGNNGNVSESGSGPVVTSITANGTGAVTVNKGQITIPVGSSSGSNGQATIWVQ